MEPPPCCSQIIACRCSTWGRARCRIQSGCSLTHPHIELSSAAALSAYTQPLSLFWQCSLCSGSPCSSQAILVSNKGGSGGQEKRQSLGESAWILCLCWGRGLAETYIQWKHVASSSLILCQQRYDLPALPATNNTPELIGGIKRSQILL